MVTRVLTTDSSGDATDTIEFHGTIDTISIDYASDSAAGTDVTVTGHIGNKSFTVYSKTNSKTDDIVRPRVPLDDATGTAIDLSDAQGGDTAMYGKFFVDKISLTVAQGGDSKTVRFDILGTKVVQE